MSASDSRDVPCCHFPTEGKADSAFAPTRWSLIFQASKAGNGGQEGRAAFGMALPQLLATGP